MKIAFDIKQMKPGCALLQAAMGCDSHISNYFDSKHWLLAPTDDLCVYEITKEQLEALVEKVKDAN